MLKKILLSAYACEPERGSEPGVGWHWAMELSKLNYEIHVLTRLSNKNKIQDYYAKNTKPSNVHFLYYDLIVAKYLSNLIKNPIVENLYYIFWQIGIFGLVKQKHREIEFDLVHHITFGVFRIPSRLYRLKVPFIFGPVGGGEDTPQSLRALIPFRYFIFDLLRRGFNLLSLHNPFLINMHKHSTVIFTKTQQTKNLIPVRFHSKIINQLEIGISNFKENRIRNTNEKFNVLYAGRLIYLKGLDLAIPAFAEFSHQFLGKAEFTIIGSGKYDQRLKEIIRKNGVTSRIHQVEWLSQNELQNYYENADVLLFPSFHDSSGNVVLEALSYGLPVVCLNCGGPAAVLGEELKELSINHKENSPEIIIKNIAQKLFELATDNDFYNTVSKKSIERAKELAWHRIVPEAYEIIEEKIRANEYKTEGVISCSSASSLAWFLNNREDYL